MSKNKKEKEILYIYKTIIFQERKNDFKKGKMISRKKKWFQKRKRNVIYIYNQSYLKKENIND